MVRCLELSRKCLAACGQGLRVARSGTERALLDRQQPTGRQVWVAETKELRRRKPIPSEGGIEWEMVALGLV